MHCIVTVVIKVLGRTGCPWLGLSALVHVVVLGNIKAMVARACPDVESDCTAEWRDQVRLGSCGADKRRWDRRFIDGGAKVVARHGREVVLEDIKHWLLC